MATVQGRSGMLFNEKSIEMLRWRLDNNSKIDSTIVNGNRIQDVALGVAQQTRSGTKDLWKDSLVQYTGTLFTF